MFSLCIPTMDRYDNFLINYLPKYIENDLIEEIIIQDENGNDINKIKNSNLSLEKIKMFKNDEILGPFLNKIEVCKKAKNEWIALMDSDNFADKDYFLAMKNFLENNKNLDKNTILSPDFATEIFRWEYLSNTNNLINKSSFKDIKEKDTNYIKNHPTAGCLHHLLNLGNFVLNKFLINNIKINTNDKIILNSHSFDVCLFLFFCFEQFNINFFLVKNCKYYHSISKDSIYIKYAAKNKKYADKTYNELYNYLNN